MGVLAITPPGGPELVIILVILLLLFGARKLPELGSSVGKTIKNFKAGIDEGAEDDANGDDPHDEVPETSRDHQ